MLPSGVSVTMRLRRSAGSVERTSRARFSSAASVCDTDDFVTARYSQTEVRPSAPRPRARQRSSAYSGMFKSSGALFLPNSAPSRLLSRNRE